MAMRCAASAFVNNCRLIDSAIRVIGAVINKNT
jgi:hypothetical protein